MSHLLKSSKNKSGTSLSTPVLATGVVEMVAHNKGQSA